MLIFFIFLSRTLQVLREFDCNCFTVNNKTSKNTDGINYLTERFSWFMKNKELFHTKHCDAIKSNLINCGFNLAPRSLQQSYRRERHVIQDCNLALSSAHAFTAKFPALGKIVPQGQRGAFRNKYIVFVFLL